MQQRLEIENPMIFPNPNYVPPIYNIVSYDLSDLYKQADAANREMARKEQSREQ